MLIKIDHLTIHYQLLGQGYPIVCLHGWGHNLSTFSALAHSLAQRHTIYLIDLPGFGLSSKPTTPLSSKEYADLIETLLNTLQIHAPIIIGHSFGGKIGIHLACRKRAEKLILISSAGIQLAKSWKTKARIYFAKLIKYLLSFKSLPSALRYQIEHYKSKLGSADYRRSTGIMRQILLKVIQEDVRDLLPQITSPTLIIWGKLDEATPLRAGKILQHGIRNSQLVIIDDGYHLLVTERLPAVQTAITKFLS